MSSYMLTITSGNLNKPLTVVEGLVVPVAPTLRPVPVYPVSLCSLSLPQLPRQADVLQFDWSTVEV